MKLYYNLKAKKLDRKLKELPKLKESLQSERERVREKLGDVKYARRLRKRAIIQGWLLPNVFKMSSRKPVDLKKVVFAYDRADIPPDNFLYIQNELEKRNAGFKISYFMRPKLSKNVIIKQIQNLLYYIKFTRQYATAGYVVLLDYFLPLYANKPRAGTRVIQLWHACGAFKKWGYSTMESNWGLDSATNERFPIHINYTHVTVSSVDVIPKYAEAFNMSEDDIWPFGVPRTDVFFEDEFVNGARSRLEEIFPIVKGKKVVLYAPTYRGNSIKNARHDELLNVEYLKEKLGGEYILVYKLHPLVAGKLDIPLNCADFAVDASGTMDISALLCAADILISDYSSLIFEYSLMMRPMVFFAYDLDRYIDDRDFYYDYEKMIPGKLTKTNSELADAVLSAYDDFDRIRMKKFSKFFMGSCDGNSTSRLVDEFFLR